MKNVKRTFFETGFLAPCYELEDGTILYPFVKDNILTWVTKDEGIKLKEEYYELKRKPKGSWF